MVVTNIFFGGGETTQRIHLDEVRCTGTETSLLNCAHNGIGVVGDCTHHDDVGIICRPSQGTVMRRMFNMCLSATCHYYHKTALMVT